MSEAERYASELAHTLHAVLSRMSVEQKVGQLIMIDIIYDSSGNPVTKVNDDVRKTLREVQPGGIILFGQNLKTVEQVRTLTADLQEESTVPLFLSTDQEGGRISRLTMAPDIPATDVPSEHVIGRTGDPRLARDAGRVLARELRALGMNMDMAPVADLDTNPGNQIVGDRAYGSDPVETGKMVAAAVRGIQSEDVCAVVKHFPGHGDTHGDSHNGRVSVPHDLARLSRVEFVPFRAGIDAGVDFVMTGHIAAPRVTGNNLPATLSPVLLGDVLRKQLKFDGIVITDDLSMKSLPPYSPGRLAVAIVQAGADMLLGPTDPREAAAALVSAVHDGTISGQRLDESVRRILRVKIERGIFVPPEADAWLTAQLATRRAAPVAPSEIGSPENRQIVRAILDAKPAE